MILVPRQLQRSGMTGNVPYYGGRLTPAQAYAAQHRGGPPASAATPAPPQKSVEERLALLEELHVEGTVTDEEFETLRARIAP